MQLELLILAGVVCFVKMQSCSKESVVENGKYFALHTSFKYNLDYTLQLRWLHNKEEVSLCIGDECVDDYPENTRTSLKYVEESHTVECNITVFNATLDCSGEWSLKYLGLAYLEHNEELFKCKLPIEGQPEIQIAESIRMSENHEMIDFRFGLVVPVFIAIGVSTIVALVVIVAIIVVKKTTPQKNKKPLLQEN